MDQIINENEIKNLEIKLIKLNFHGIFCFILSIEQSMIKFISFKNFTQRFQQNTRIENMF